MIVIFFQEEEDSIHHSPHISERTHTCMPIGLFGLIVHGILGVRVFAIEWLIMVLIKFTFRRYNYVFALMTM